MSRGLEWALVGVAVVVIGAGVVTLFVDTPNRLDSDERQVALATSYEENLRGALEKYSASMPGINDSGRAQATSRAKESLLTFIVPTSYKETHLALVIALTQLEQGYNGSADRLTAGQTLYTEIVDRYDWLPSVQF